MLDSQDKQRAGIVRTNYAEVAVMPSGLEVIHSLLLVVYDIRVFPMRYPRHRPRLSNFIGNVLPGWDAVKTFSLTASFPFALQLTCFSLTIES